MSASTLFTALQAQRGPLEPEETTTENGAISNAVVDLSGSKEGLLGLFYKTVRGINEDILLQYLDRARKESVIDAILIAFYVRDCRGGKGEREIARECFNHLAKDMISRHYLRKILSQIPEYGRWDDLIILSENSLLRDSIYEILITQLKKDKIAMKNNQPASLLAKWMPTENHKLDKKLGFVENFCKYSKNSKKKYRVLISALRAHIDILERKMCNGEWSVIDYSTVPSCAMHKLKKAFLKNDAIRFEEWKNKLAAPNSKVKVNAKQLFPYEIVRDYLESNSVISRPDPLLEAQWKVLVDQINPKINKAAPLQNSLVVCDTSGSMFSGSNKNVLPIHVAISLALILSEVTEAPFNNKVITFSDKPAFFDTTASSLSQRINILRSAPWEMNTNLQAVFSLILRVANANKIKAENMPRRIIIVSDMQFDKACSSNRRTNFEQIDREYLKYSYERPQIVFWNVNGKFDDFPVQIHDNGAVLISGFNAQIIKYLVDGRDITPWDIVNNTLSNERYNCLRTLMND